MWIESHETMAVEGFMVQARVQRSAPDEVHTVTVVERPDAVEGSKQYLWSVETVYGTLVAEGSSPSEDEAKSEALTAAKADGGANDPEEFEQALQSTAERTDDPWMAVMPRLEELDAKAWDGLTEEEAAERERLQNDAVEMGFRLPSVYQRGVDLGHDGYEASLDLGRMTQQAAVASEDYPGLSDVLEERPPLEHNAGRFPDDDEPEAEDIQPLGLKELTEPGEDEQGMNSWLAMMVGTCAEAIYGFVTGSHNDADKAYSSYNLLTADERLSKTQRGSKAIHIYETAVR